MAEAPEGEDRDGGPETGDGEEDVDVDEVGEVAD